MAVTAGIAERARRIGALVTAHQEECRTLRRLPDAIAAAFLEEDVFRLLLPPELGGAGMAPPDFFDLVEQVSFHDGSVGWNYAIGGGAALAAGYIAPEVSRSLFADPDCGIGGSAAPTGRADMVPGGYRLSGHWGWASGIHQSKWVLAGAVVHDGGAIARDGNGQPVTLQMLLPRSQCTILDAWHVGGLRGTGSTEFTIDDAFVPDAMSYRMFVGEVLHPALIFQVPSSYFGLPLCAVGLGVARAAVAALKQLAADQRLPPGRPRLADQPAVQYAVAKAEAMVDAASLGARAGFALIWDKLCAGEAVTLADRARARRGYVHAAEASADAAQLCYRAAGGAALFEAHPFERCTRDTLAVMGHVVLQTATMEDAGRVAFGLAPRAVFF